MKIGTYNIEFGDMTTPTTRKYIQARVEALAKGIQRRIGDKYEVRFYPSSSSESSYIRIRMRDGDVSYMLSFRNHGRFSKQPYDREVLLSDYDTWLECKHDFLERILPEVMEEVNTVRWAQRRITLPIVAEMLQALKETGATE